MSLVAEVTDQTFVEAVKNSPILTLVDFWAPWCGPCKQLAPHVDRIATENPDTLRVLKMDIDQNPSTAQNLGIRSIPLVMLFKNGQIVGQSVGAVPYDTLKTLVAKAA